MQRTLIVDLPGKYSQPDSADGTKLTVCGWVRTRRNASGFCFLELNDGSCLATLQCIVSNECASKTCPGFDKVNTGAALRLEGRLVPSPGKGQQWELQATAVEILGLADPESYPLQKKRHSDEFLRGIAHLRARTNKYSAVFRIRAEAGLAIHQFFRSRHFAWVHTPILTGSDCEGAGELFQVSTLADSGKADADEFFNRPCRLTVSGQLEAEALAMGLGRVYTFGPTFRAENSNTARHAAEFWMVEPEMAFADLNDVMELAESLTVHVIVHVLDNCAADVALFDKFVSNGLLGRLEKIIKEPFARVAYREAVEILQKSGQHFAYPVAFGTDLQTEHERFLAESHFGRPVLVHDYPRQIKPFYMRANDDGETVAAVDMLVPGIGELIGGSQREERLDLLLARLAELGQNPDDYWWYNDLRRFGSAPHGGFGLGFERLLMLLTGISNIRDVIPFPRTPGSLEF